MDRLLAGPPATAVRATVRKGIRTVRRDASAFPASGLSGLPRPVVRGASRAVADAQRPSLVRLAAGTSAILDINKEDFLNTNTTKSADLLRTAQETLTEAKATAAMPLAMRAAKKTAAKKPAAKKPAAKKAAAKKPAARKAAPKKAAAKRTTTARKPAAKKAVAKKPAAKKPAAKKAAAKKPAAKKAAKAAKPAAKRVVRRPRKAAPAADAPATPAEGA